MRYALIFSLAAVLAAADQAVKLLVVRSLALFEEVPVTSFFNLVHVRNYGAAFGFLNDPSSTWQLWLFLGATVLACGVALYVAAGAGKRDYLLFIALGCILGGAAGNAIDRIRLQAVVDFLDLHYRGWHWPAFNLADIAICVGAGLIVLLSFCRPAAPQRQGGVRSGRNLRPEDAGPP